MAQRNLKPRKVLYVEDEVLIALDGEEMLHRLGFTDVSVALSFRDGEKAIQTQQFDLALLDINLGGGRTSLTLADTLMKRGVPVLFLSGYGQSEDLSERVRAPMIAKPFDEETLRSAIASVLEG